MAEKYSAANVDNEMFEDDINWDRHSSFMYDGTRFERKCRKFLWINWCYCKASNMPLPMPCVHIPHKNAKRKKERRSPRRNHWFLNGFLNHGDATQSYHNQYFHPYSFPITVLLPHSFSVCSTLYYLPSMNSNDQYLSVL